MKRLETIIEESFDSVPKLMDYPIRRELLSYPIDLTGHHCELDCAFTERRLAIEAAARTKPAPVREYIAKLEQSMDEALTDNCQRVALSYRQADISEYLIEAEALHGDTSRLEQGISYVKTALRSDPAIASMEAGLMAAEYVAGLRKEPAQIPKEVLSACEKEFHCPFDWEAYRLGRTAAAELTTLEIHMEDTGWYPRFMAVSDLKLYAPETHPDFSPPSAKDYDAYLEQFTRETYRRELAVYEPLEEQELCPATDGQTRTDPVTRDDLIFIDGISLKDWTSYSMELHPEAASREAVSASLLSQALSNSEHYVECYLPDEADRTIRTEPVRLTQEGIKPAEMEKPSMSAWQRFWSKHGHYQELAARMEHFETIDGFRKQSAESVKALSAGISTAWQKKASTQFIKQCGDGAKKAAAARTALGVQLFGPEYGVNRGGVTDSSFYRLKRSGANLGICLLLHDGLTLEDIMDPEKEIEKKQAAGETLKAMALRNDPRELLSFTVPAMEQIMALPNLEMDYMDFTQAAPHAPEIDARGCLFDMYQETGRTKEVIQEVMGREESAEFLDRAERYGTFYHRLSQCIELSIHEPGAEASSLVNGISYLGQYQAMVRDFGPQMNGGAAPDRIPDTHDALQSAILAEGISKSEDHGDSLQRLLEHGLSGRPVVASLMSPTPQNPFPQVRLSGLEDSPQKTTPAPAVQARTR